MATYGLPGSSMASELDLLSQLTHISLVGHTPVYKTSCVLCLYDSSYHMYIRLLLSIQLQKRKVFSMIPTTNFQARFGKKRAFILVVCRSDYRIAGNFRRVKLSRNDDHKDFTGLIFEDRALARR